MNFLRVKSIKRSKSARSPARHVEGIYCLPRRRAERKRWGYWPLTAVVVHYTASVLCVDSLVGQGEVRSSFLDGGGH